ncbi:crotonase [bacterium]|nr:MAG: crotonase [bacterium]
MLSQLEYQNLLIEQDGAIATITINRPDKLNALNEQTLKELAEVLDDANNDAEVRVVILTGAGKAFVAGADIAELNALPSAVEGMRKARYGQSLTKKIERMRKPVIVAVNGFALGGGCELAMAGDFRIASEKAKFGQPEVNLGLCPGYGGTQRLPRLVGRGMGMYLCLTGEMIDAQEAWRIGLVEKVVPADQLLPEAKRIAKLIASKAPLAVELTKQSINEGIGVTLAEGLAVEALNFGLLVNTEDIKEGTSAFLEKRPAEFKGR